MRSGSDLGHVRYNGCARVFRRNVICNFLVKSAAASHNGMFELPAHVFVLEQEYQ